MSEHVRGELILYESPEGKVPDRPLQPRRDHLSRLPREQRQNKLHWAVTGNTAAELIAKRLAETEYAKFRVRQDREFEGDFEREVKRLRRDGK
ncbi:MAG: hypothetical protein Tsb0020_16750 [Haliangiales bacterium]